MLKLFNCLLNVRIKYGGGLRGEIKTLRSKSYIKIRTIVYYFFVYLVLCKKGNVGYLRNSLRVSERISNREDNTNFISHNFRVISIWQTSDKNINPNIFSTIHILQCILYTVYCCILTAVYKSSLSPIINIIVSSQNDTRVGGVGGGGKRVGRTQEFKEQYIQSG